MARLRSVWLLALLALVALSVPLLTAASRGDAEHEGAVDLETEVDQAADVANHLLADQKQTSVLEGEAVSDSEQELFDGVSQQLFGHVHHLSDTDAETEAANEAEQEVMDQAAAEERLEAKQAVERDGQQDASLIESSRRRRKGGKHRAQPTPQAQVPSPDQGGAGMPMGQGMPPQDGQKAARGRGGRRGRHGRHHRRHGKGQRKMHAKHPKHGKGHGKQSQRKMHAKSQNKGQAKKQEKKQRPKRKLSRKQRRTRRKAKRMARKMAKKMAKKLAKKISKRLDKKTRKMKKRAKKELIKTWDKQHADSYTNTLKAHREKKHRKREIERAMKAELAKRARAKPLAQHLQSKDSYAAKRANAKRSLRSKAMLKKALVAKALKAQQENAAKIAAAKSKLAKQRALDALNKKKNARNSKALKLRRKLNDIAAAKHKIAKQLFLKKSISKQAKDMERAAMEEAKRAQKQRRLIARQQLRMMKEREAVDRMKREVRTLAEKAHQLHAKMQAIKHGDKPLGTAGVIEDGLGDGRLEDGYVRNVPRPDRQAQKAFDAAIGMVMPEAEQMAGNIQQINLDESRLMGKHADEVRNRFDDFKIEMKTARATPEGWPSAVFEADVLPE